MKTHRFLRLLRIVRPTTIAEDVAVLIRLHADALKYLHGLTTTTETRKP